MSKTKAKITTLASAGPTLGFGSPKEFILQYLAKKIEDWSTDQMSNPHILLSEVSQQSSVALLNAQIFAEQIARSVPHHEIQKATDRAWHDLKNYLERVPNSRPAKIIKTDDLPSLEEIEKRERAWENPDTEKWRDGFWSKESVAMRFEQSRSGLTPEQIEGRKRKLFQAVQFDLKPRMGAAK